jgi:hypothetical protein
MNNNDIVVDCDDLKFEHPSNWLMGLPVKAENHIRFIKF